MDLLTVELGLAVNTEAYAGHRLAASLRDFDVTLGTSLETLTLRQLASGELYSVFNAGIDLLLYGTIPRPATGHRLNLC